MIFALTGCGGQVAKDTTIGPGSSNLQRAYRDAMGACEAFPRGKIAAEYGADPASAMSIADAYAKATYDLAPLRREARRGCLAGLDGAPR